MFAAKPSDTLIVRVTYHRYNVIDAVTGELIITTSTLWDALDGAREPAVRHRALAVTRGLTQPSSLRMLGMEWGWSTVSPRSR